MNRHRVLLAAVGLVMAGFTACGGTASTPGNGTPPPNSFHETSQDPSGTLDTFSHQKIDKTGPFFAQLGSNGRSCSSCHDAADGWSITPAHLQQRFNNSQGTDPIFRTLDGANCPSDDVSTPAAATSAYSQLLNHGLIRMTLPMPANAEFSIVAITDPYQCPETTATQPALYRRPLPSTNLKFSMASCGTAASPTCKPRPWTQPWSMPYPAVRQAMLSYNRL
jgi:cytochrome c peroxidase